MGQPVPDNDHVARYCKGSDFDDDGRCTYAAFLLRPATSGKVREDYLSVFWLDSLTRSDRAAPIVKLRAEVSRLQVLNPGKTAKYAVLNVGRTRATVNARCADSRWIRITEETDGHPYFHAGIHDTADEEETVAAAISDSIVEIHPAK